MEENEKEEESTERGEREMSGGSHLKEEEKGGPGVIAKLPSLLSPFLLFFSGLKLFKNWYR